MVSVHQSYHPEEVWLIGVIAIEGAFFDLQLGIAEARITGKSEDGMHNPKMGDISRKKVVSLRKQPNLPDSLTQVLESVDQLLDDRNYAIHGTKVYSVENGLLTRSDVGLREPYRSQPVDRDVVWLRSVANRLAASNKMLINFLHPERRKTPHTDPA